MARVSKKIIYLMLGTSLAVLSLVAFVVLRGNPATPATGTPSVGAPSPESTADCVPGTPEVKIIYFGGENTATPYFNIWNGCDWYYKQNGEMFWMQGTGPTATPTPWVTWTPMPEPVDIELVNINLEAGAAEVENKTNVPIMFVDGTRAVHFDYFDPLKMESYEKDVLPGRAAWMYYISCVVYPGERGYLDVWPGVAAEVRLRSVYHYQLFAVPRPDLEAKRDYIHMPYENLEWKVEGDELRFSFDMEKFDEHELYVRHGFYDIVGSLFLYDKEGNLLNLLTVLLRGSGGGHLENWSADNRTSGRSGYWGPSGGSLHLDRIDHVRLLIEREEQPDCIRYSDKDYGFTPTPTAANTPTVAT
jgi:hypothetical protein